MREARLARRALLIAGAAAAALGLGATAASADDWGQRVAGQHVYDNAGALTPAQVTDLEQSAAAVDRAGASTGGGGFMGGGAYGGASSGSSSGGGSF